MITVTPCSTHHSNQLLTHSLTIGKKIESPRRSLRSLWGLIKEVEVGSKSDTRQEGLRETLEVFFNSVESQCQVGGMTVGYLVGSLQQHLHLSEEDAEHIVVLLGGDISAHIKK